MTKTLGIIAAVGGFLAVACGAFAAHGLKGTTSPPLMAVWHTAVSYQMYHSLALLALALHPDASAPRFRCAGWLLVAGTVVFSGSLYALVLLDAPQLGRVTPVGGLLLLGGWATLVWAFARRKNSEE